MQLDRVAAVVGTVVSAVLALYVGVFNRNPSYLLTVVLAAAACLVWLARSKGVTLDIDLPGSRVAAVCLYCVFSVLFSTSVLAVYLRPDPNVRPLAYFVLSSMMATTVAAEIIIGRLSAPRYVAAVIIQIMIIGLSLSWTEQLIFPSVTGIDPAWHMMFTLKLLEAGRVPANYGYSSFPIFHLTTGMVMLTTGTSYKIAAMISTGLVQVLVDVTLVFLLGKFLARSDRVGLLGGLTLVTADYYLQFGWSTVPTTLAAAFLLATLYLILRVRPTHPLRTILLVLLLGFTLVLTHTVTAVALTLVLFVLWAIGFSGRRLSLSRYLGSPTRAGVPLLFSVFIFAWWSYAFSTPFGALASLIGSGFSLDAFSQGPRYLGYPSTLPLVERVLDVLGFVLFFACSIIGCLHLMSRKELNSLSFAGIGITLLLVGFVSLILRREILNARWWYYAQLLLALPAAMGILLVSSLVRKPGMRRSMTATAIFVLSLLMIVGSTANTDNGMLSPGLVIRKAFTASEMTAAAFLANHWGANISSDFLYGTNPSSSVFADYYNVDPGRLRSLDSALVTRDYSETRGLLVIRSEITSHPFLLAAGFYRLNYDPNEILSASAFDKIYDCGSVSAYQYSG